MNQIEMLKILKTDYFHLWFLNKSKMQISTARNLTPLNLEKRQYLPHFGLHKGFKHTLMNLALPFIHL